MPRKIAEVLVWFMIPFGIYAGYLLVQLISPFELDRWTRRVLIPLTLAGIALVVASLVYSGLTADRYEGGYRPAHIENGRIVPGEMR